MITLEDAVAAKAMVEDWRKYIMQKQSRLNMMDAVLEVEIELLHEMERVAQIMETYVARESETQRKAGE